MKKEKMNFYEHSQPKACAMMQFHAAFVYEKQIKIINLITRQEHDIDTFSNLKGIDIYRESILVYCSKAPLYYSEFKNESEEIWRCYLDQDLLKEALLYC